MKLKYEPPRLTCVGNIEEIVRRSRILTGLGQIVAFLLVAGAAVAVALLLP